MPQNKIIQQALIGCLLAVAAALPAAAKSKSLINPGDPLPAFRATASETREFVSPADLEGKVTIFVLFGTWCPVCKRFFTDLKPRLTDLKAQGVQVVALGQDHTIEELLAFRDDHGWTGVQYLADPGFHIQKLFGTGSVPQIYIVDRRGQVIDHIAGYAEAAWTRIDKQVRYAGQR